MFQLMEKKHLNKQLCQYCVVLIVDFQTDQTLHECRQRSTDSRDGSRRYLTAQLLIRHRLTTDDQQLTQAAPKTNC